MIKIKNFIYHIQNNKMKNFLTFIKESTKVENSPSIKCYNLKIENNRNCFILVEDSKYIVASLEFFKFENDFRVENVIAVKGYGPLIYEYCLDFIYPKYLGTYKSQTKDALKVWNIFKERKDIETKEDVSKYRVIDFMIASKFKLNKILDCPDFVEYHIDNFLNEFVPKKMKIEY